MEENHTILLVEDNLDDVLLIRRAFRRCGVKLDLRVVGDGDAAVAYLAGEDAFADRALHPVPALILLDLKLPRRSGLEVLEWRSTQPIRSVPVVVLTSSEQRSDVDRAYELGANSYLVKPGSFDQLVRIAETLGLYWLSMNALPSAALNW